MKKNGKTNRFKYTESLNNQNIQDCMNDEFAKTAATHVEKYDNSSIFDSDWFISYMDLVNMFQAR